MINNINNGDSASEIRAKLNEMISIINDYSSSQYVSNPDPGAGGDPGGAGGDTGMDYLITVYTSMTPPPLTVDANGSTACEALNTGFSSNAYISKSPSNMGGTQVPEVGDTLYQYYPYSNTFGMGYVGFRDSMMMNKYIETDMYGQIVSINDCV